MAWYGMVWFSMVGMVYGMGLMICDQLNVSYNQIQHFVKHSPVQACPELGQVAVPVCFYTPPQITMMILPIAHTILTLWPIVHYWHILACTDQLPLQCSLGTIQPTQV